MYPSNDNVVMSRLTGDLATPDNGRLGDTYELETAKNQLKSVINLQARLLAAQRFRQQQGHLLR